MSATVPGEYSSGSDALSTYEGLRFFAWFDHYLKGTTTPTGPAFSYYRDWVPFSGSGPDTVQYGNASSFPTGATQTLYMSQTNRLVTARSAVQHGTAQFTAGPEEGNYSETSAVQGSVPPPLSNTRDLPGTFAAYNGATLAHDVDVVGIPRATLNVDVPATNAVGPAGELVVFVKLYDVDAAGNKTLVNRLVAPIRIADPTKPVNVTLPGIVHRFAAGHHFQLVVAGSDAAYKGTNVPIAVGVSTSRVTPGLLQLPVVG